MSDDKFFQPLEIRKNFFSQGQKYWSCFLTGNENFVLKVKEGSEPNWFWRKIQYIFFGIRWKKHE